MSRITDQTRYIKKCSFLFIPMKMFLFQLGYYWNFSCTPKRGIIDNLWCYCESEEICGSTLTHTGCKYIYIKFLQGVIISIPYVRSCQNKLLVEL